MLWMNFYVMQSGAVMSHPSVEGHWYVLDCILECIDGFDGIDFGYYEGGFMDITLEDLGIEEGVAVIDTAELPQRACGIKKCFRKGGFAGVNVRQNTRNEFIQIDHHKNQYSYLYYTNKRRPLQIKMTRLEI